MSNSEYSLGGEKMEEYYEDQDYIRYYQLFNDPEVVELEESDDLDPELMLEDDEISDREEGFLIGYEAY
jgi:hypothetical protein